MSVLTNHLQQIEDYRLLLAAIGQGQNSYLHGPVQDALPWLAKSFFEELDQTVLLVTETDKRAKEYAEALSAFEEEKVFYLPHREYSFYDVEQVDDKGERQWLDVLTALRKSPILIIAPINSLSRKISKKAIFNRGIFSIKADSVLDLEDLTEQLVAYGYERVPFVGGRGQFSIRGGIVDIFSMQETDPTRIELFGDEIDSMRRFEIDTQRSIENMEELLISPAKELILSESSREELIQRLEKEIDRAKDSVLYGIDKDQLIEKYEHILGQIKEGQDLLNEDLIRPFLMKKDYDLLFDYLGKDSLLVYDDLSRIYDYYERTHHEFLEDFTEQIQRGEVFENRYEMKVDLRDLLAQAKAFTSVNSTQLLKKTRLVEPKKIFQINIQEAPRFHRQMDMLLDYIKTNLYQGKKIVLFASEERKKLLAEFLEEESLHAMDLSQVDELKTGQIYLSDEKLNQGFEFVQNKVVFLSEKEIYGVERRKVRRRKEKKAAKDFLHYQDLEIGDYIVHENHGIGRYVGMEQVEVAGNINDFIIIQYRGNDKLYIPTDQMDLVQKYIGKDAVQPKIHKLGDASWQRSKSRAKKEVDAIAEDLVRLYAKREKMEGYAFSKDSQWQKEFEDAFIYEETYGQLRSIEEIKRDMESHRPMDRLLCADVGFGKTEVALRAAFKAVMDSKQVAFLVPTTILAKQHYDNIARRLEDFPINLAMLSRFVSASEQKKVFQGLKNGSIDIVIGTHRILSDKLKFHDIGLLIIDEEQRFGVRQKEKIKALKENIDVLTLSATPIPRTLQMSLTGIRDMSVIDEPPQERYPTNTYIMEYKEQIIRDAIYREVGRGGQVYFVYNRVETIEKMRQDLEKMLPDLSISVAHGQLAERQLEDVILDFEAGNSDILLCTTIIETGMDIQNVNTMIVYHADHMGLSQLYQLKGRIGRSNRSSFAYFTYEEGKVLTEISEKRLKAIKDFSDFGSGFRIAMRDLELRGAGNLLGESQSGQLSAVGYELYIKMLEESVKKIKGEDISPKEEVQIDIPLSAYIPSEYIRENNEKIVMYQKIAGIESEEEYDDLIHELIDRFGDVPRSILNIMDISYMKSLAGRLKIERISQDQDYMNFFWQEGKSPSKEALARLNEEVDKLVFDLSNGFMIKMPFDGDLKILIKALQILLESL